jgi:hypothetical protein
MILITPLISSIKALAIYIFSIFQSNEKKLNKYNIPMRIFSVDDKTIDNNHTEILREKVHVGLV